MQYSLNEIDSHCKKAARGAGFSWGHAEEVGKAIRWLSAQQLPGVRVLAAYLSERAVNSDVLPTVIKESTLWQVGDNECVTCPILAGGYLCDWAEAVTSVAVHMHQIAYPLLLVPYLAAIVDSQNKACVFKCDTLTLTIVKRRVFSNSPNLITMANGRAVSVTWSVLSERVNDDSDIGEIGVTRLAIDAHDWSVLNAFCCRTYVPASKASRLGAGPSE